jgi:hypothetical protein
VHVLDERHIFADSQVASDDPQFPGDYCDYCNCSIPRTGQDDRMWMYDDVIASPEMAEQDEGAEDFSGTNNQVDGVDEADSVKNDGQYIYMLPKAHGVSQVCRFSACTLA